MNKPKGFKKYFKLNSLRRIIILGATATAAILAIILGSVFYTADSNNIRKSSEYSANAEYNIQVKKARSNNDSLTEIANQVYDRIDPLGLKGAKVSTYTENNNDFIKIIYPNVKTDEEMKSVERLITHKPKITLTNTSGQPIFSQTGTGLWTQTSNSQNPNAWDLKNWNSNMVNDSTVPLLRDSASVVNNNGSMRIKINLPSISSNSAWMYAALNLSNNSSQTSTTNSSKVVLWSDIDEWIDELKNIQTAKQGVSLWDETGNDPYKALYINNDPTTGILRNDASFFSSNALNHRLAEFDLSTNSTLVGYQYLVLKDGFDLGQINEIVRKINFSTAQFELTTVSSQILAPSQGSTAFRNFIIFAAVAFSLIAVALMINYGLLGALATISLALFTFITLTLFTVMRGEYSPESIAALIVGFGLSLDATISMFERLRSELYLSHNLAKSSKTTNRKSLWKIIDTNVIMLTLATVLFYFGTKSIIGFSISMVFGIILTFVVTNLFIGVTTALLLRSGYLDKRTGWIGIHKKIDEKIQFTSNKIDFVKQARWSFFAGIVFVAVGIVVSIALGVIHGGNGLFKHKSINLNMVNDFLIAVGISFAVIAAYVLIRFRWTYLVTLLYALIQDAWLILALFIAARIKVSPTFIAVLLGFVMLSLNDKIVTFDRLKEKIKTKYNLTDYIQIKDAANEAIRTLFRRSVLTTTLLILSTAILMAVGNVILWQSSLVLLVGLVLNFASSNFIVPAVWTKMEIIRQKGIAWRTKKNFWDTKSVEEQVIVGINDYRQ